MEENTVKLSCRNPVNIGGLTLLLFDVRFVPLLNILFIFFEVLMEI
jgi:hypothetical protein